MKKWIVLLSICSMGLSALAQMKKEAFEFEFDGIQLNGVLNLPEKEQCKGMVLIVHGSGRTNAVAQELFYDIREQLVKSGYAVYMWDKMGCGKSGGTFDYHQSIESSASEVIAAINTLKEERVLGATDIGLWGISRAGWVIPLVINQYQGIKFWISVSGVDAQENFKYLLRENLRINGHPKDTVELLVNEWQAGVNITHAGGSFSAYQEATQNLRLNPFLLRFTGGSASEEGYKAWQTTFMQQELDQESGLAIYVRDFEHILSKVDCPVLALFGEKDMNVDWEKTKTLYQKTLGETTDLNIQSFPHCNHNLFECKTGGFYEIQDNNLPWKRCEGFLDAMAKWLATLK